MRLASAIAVRAAGVLAFLALDACASAPHQSAAAMAAPAKAGLESCLRNVQNAVSDTWFLCSLASSTLAHKEAGREQIGNADCVASPEACQASDTSLVVRVLFSPPVFGKGPPRASSIELAGFDKARAHADMRELVGPETWFTEQRMSTFERPPMKPGARSQFDLSEQATAEILKLAHDLRSEPEQASWTLCTIDVPNDANDQVIMMGDAAGIFIQFFFGGEEYAYLRNSMYLGHAGDVAALLFGDERNTDACVPDRRL